MVKRCMNDDKHGYLMQACNACYTRQMLVEPAVAISQVTGAQQQQQQQ